MATLTAAVKSYNPHKGWGFIELNGRDIFLQKNELGGYCPEKGNQVQFTINETEKGPQATGVTVLVSPDEVRYTGEFKSFNPAKGFGFITSEAFPGQDVFVMRTEMSSTFVQAGCPCKFKVKIDEKGPQAEDVFLLGTQGDQAMRMKAMMGMMGMGGKGGGKGAWKPMFSKGSGKGKW
eukprot:TRINITY_DN4895_c0_g1_i1.p2 TRINITY_DN4895_c0_g1~~TRINITY_DN4895_c0_g1_i1.p2  ORF type:complete len:188 (+),score=52.05 TRINITY_DN4895_c0_g1_i1:31-564(+)